MTTQAMHGVPAVLAWTLLVWVSSTLGFLLTRPLFLPWVDQGYGLAKIVGPFLLGAVAWFLAGTIGAPFDIRTASIALALLAVCAALSSWHLGRAPWPAIRVLLTLEVAMIAGVAAFGFMRLWSPSAAGAERPMDHALLAAALGQGVVPAVDPWLSGHPVNYHYAGHAWWAAFGLLAQQPPWVVYNLVLITLPAQLLAAGWSVGHRLHATWAWAAALVLVAAGSWAPAMVAMRKAGLPTMFETTRVIPGTINEFPFFSLVWGDLHAHVLAMPLLVGLAAVVLRVDEHARGSVRRAELVALCALAAGLGTASILTSSWDVVPAALAAGWGTWVVVTHARGAVVPALCVAATVAVALAWPTLVSFHPPDVPWGWEWHGSPLGPFVLVLGTWLIPTLLLCLTASWTRPLALAWLAWPLTVWLIPGMAVRGLLLLTAIGVWRARARLGRHAAALTLSATGLLILAECVWVDDVYGWDLRRMNTVFKWHLHAIVLFALALPGVTHALWAERQWRWRVASRAVLVALAVAATLGPAVVVTSRWVQREPAWSWNGLAGMSRRHPGDAAAVLHLWEHAGRLDTIVEAVGESYTYGARISAMSGRPTLLGWAQHERLWRRGTKWESLIGHRERVVDAIYAGPPDEIARHFEAERVRYVVVGPVERRRYPGLTATRFASLADAVVSTEGTVLLRVH